VEKQAKSFKLTFLEVKIKEQLLSSSLNSIFWLSDLANLIGSSSKLTVEILILS
jgi:hypothetical protein